MSCPVIADARNDQWFDRWWSSIEAKIDSDVETTPRPELAFNNDLILSQVWNEAIRFHDFLRGFVPSLTRWLECYIALAEMPERPSPKEIDELDLDFHRVLSGLEYPRCPLLEEAFREPAEYTPVELGVKRSIINARREAPIFRALVKLVRESAEAWDESASGALVIVEDPIQRRIQAVLARIALKLLETSQRWFERNEYVLLARELDGKLAYTSSRLIEDQFLPAPSNNGRTTESDRIALEAPADRLKLGATNRSADQENAEKLRSALREMGAIDEESKKQKGALRLETGLKEREYRNAIKLLKAEKAVRTKQGVGTWLTN